MVIAIGILLFVGVSFILTAIYIKKSVIKKTTNCTKCIDAKIVDIKKEYDRIDPDSMRSLAYRNYYQYTYNNDTFNVESKFLTSNQKYKKGQNIKLYINPNNPEEFYNKEDNYNILIYIFSIVGIVLFAIGLILIVTQSSLREKQNENIYDNNISDNDDINENNQISEDNSDNTYHVLYDNKIEESLNINQSYKNFNFKIDGGFLIITDSSGTNFKLESIPNVKNLLLITPTSYDNLRLFILTSTGEIYYIDNVYNHSVASDFVTYQKLAFDYKADEIGYTKDYVSPPVATFLVVKSNGKEYMFTDTSYIKHIEINNSNLYEEIYNKYEKIELSQEAESFDFGKLHLDFNGVPTNNGDDYLKYVLNIRYDGKDINNTFFNDKENYRIWSSNMAANFKIYQLENVYILISYIAKQCFCDEILIFNTDGDVLKTFTTAEFSIDGQNIVIKTSDNGQCMGDNWEKHVTEYKFKINDSKLIEQ